MRSLGHLGWIPAGAAVSFVTSFLLGDLLPLRVDFYYLLYFAVILVFLTVYARTSELRLGAVASRRLLPGLALGVLVGVFMVGNVLSRPETGRLEGVALAAAVGWRGLAYGAVDGLLLLAFPWLVVWRALRAEGAPVGRRMGASLLAWVGILLVTTAYHLGYGDFRSRKILQPNLGNSIMSLPTLVSGNPVASPVTHVFLHVAAVVHTPETDLFLPPHRD